MKRETLLEKGYTEEQVTELLDLFHKNSSNISKENEDLKTQLDSANNKIAGLTKLEQELNALKQSQLSEEEKRKLAEKEMQENLYKSKIILNTAKAREILSQIGGIDEEVLNSIVSDNEEKTIKNANGLLNLIKTREERTISETTEKLSSMDVKPAPSNNLNQDTQMTWEKFESLSVEEQSKFEQEHPDEFAKL